MAAPDFKVNDKVVHPQYGGGYVAGIESIEIGGQAIECLKISCVSKGRKIFVPKGSVELSAIRPPLIGRRSHSSRFRCWRSPTKPRMKIGSTWRCSARS